METLVEENKQLKGRLNILTQLLKADHKQYPDKWKVRAVPDTTNTLLPGLPILVNPWLKSPTLGEIFDAIEPLRTFLLEYGKGSVHSVGKHSPDFPENYLLVFCDLNTVPAIPSDIGPFHLCLVDAKIT